MKLHEDKFAFLNIINLIHEASSIRADILEKDYYVTLLLRELAGKQVTLPAYFKGGTALYKAQKSIRRFSEDIDLTVCIDNCSNSQAKKRLEMATKKYQALPRTSRKDLEDDRKGSITTVYDYTPLVGVDSDDPLQRFGYVKVEGTSFTVSEPFTPLEIEPILYTYATEEQRNILQSQYNVAPFMINLYQPITFSKADFIASSKVTLIDWPESPSSWLISWSDFVRYFLLHFCLQQHQERSPVKNSALGAFSFTC